MHTIHKYPRTRHIQGSRVQPGDEDLAVVPFHQILDRNVVIEEKVDGANCGISFTASGELRLQSRGHYLVGGGRERHFSLFKQWATTHQRQLFDRLSHRYVMYGEWLYAKHTMFYDALPHFFLEFDVLDVDSGEFLSTQRRVQLLEGLPIASVHILFQGKLNRKSRLTDLIGESHFIRSGHLERLCEQARELKIDIDRVLRETDCSTKMEGLYIKVEENDVVAERYKFVRREFLATVFAAQGHWLNRTIVPNMLCADADMFSP